jgi:hypothetical protein
MWMLFPLTLIHAVNRLQDKRIPEIFNCLVYAVTVTSLARTRERARERRSRKTERLIRNGGRPDLKDL